MVHVEADQVARQDMTFLPSDLAPAIPVVFPLLGLGGCWLLGAKAKIGPLGTFFFALVFGVILTLAQSFALTVCIESLRMCVSRGDGNMSYWFQSFFCIPLFWMAGVAGFARSRGEPWWPSLL